MKKLLMILAIMAIATGASQVTAQTPQTYCYGWEDQGDILGGYLLDQMFYATTTDNPRTDNYSLEIYEIEGSGTPNAYVAWVTGLVEGDVVDASFWTYDEVDSNPSCRIWGAWTDGSDINGFIGSAGGNNTYSGPGTEWIQLSWSWTVDATHAGQGLAIHIRPYNAAPWTGSNWVDDLCVVFPETATLEVPGGTVATENSSWGGVKSLYR